MVYCEPHYVAHPFPTISARFQVCDAMPSAISSILESVMSTASWTDGEQDTLDITSLGYLQVSEMYSKHSLPVESPNRKAIKQAAKLKQNRLSSQ